MAMPSSGVEPARDILAGSDYAGSRGGQEEGERWGGKGSMADGTGPGERKLRGPHSWRSGRRMWDSWQRGQ